MNTYLARLRSRCVRHIRTTATAFVNFHVLGAFKIRAAAVIGLVTFPLYFVLWSYVLPQPYESLALRGVGMAICLGLGLGPWWPKALRRFYYLYAYLGLMYCLPVFFTIMLLMNDANPIWLMSTMAAFVFIVLLYDVRNAVIVCMLGSAAGVMLFWLLTELRPLPIAYLASLPVFVFVLIAVAFLSYTERLVSREKLLAAFGLASNIAHEMRTPLAGIRLDAEAVRDNLAELMEAQRWAEQNGWKGGKQPAGSQAALRAGVERIIEHTMAANMVIDMLLTNLTRDRIPEHDFTAHSILATIAKAMDRYHFRRGERELVRLAAADDFEYFGSEVLMMHVIYNLLKNSLRAISMTGQGAIVIECRAASSGGTVVVRDTALGIPSERLPLLFIPFMTSNPERQGTGIGLAFCKQVMESFGGSIVCHSTPGVGTEFILGLPGERGVGKLIQPRSGDDASSRATAAAN